MTALRRDRLARARDRLDTDGRAEHALGHELRVRIVEAAHHRATISAVELATELGVPISNVAYHVRRLCALRMLELDHETRARGAVCRHYRLSSDGARVGSRGALMGAVHDVARTARALATEGAATPVHALHCAVALDSEARATLDAALRHVADLLPELEAATRLRGGAAAPVTLALLVAHDARG